ncbi:MAG: 50S ribosomal protein L18 [Patescibacteria group bacterium]|jgi:large subunit ribosomal protein L18
MNISGQQKHTNNQRTRREKRVRYELLEKKTAPRLSVFRSGKFIYAQVIDDVKRVTVAACSDRVLKEPKSPIERAKIVGKKIAELAKAKKVEKVVFDRSWYKFHGRIKALADAAREGGLIF